jgi:hypothetical protein
LPSGRPEGKLRPDPVAQSGCGLQILRAAIMAGYVYPAVNAYIVGNCR